MSDTNQLVDVANERTQMLRSRHEAIIDLLISSPHLSMKEISASVGLSAAYLSTLINSDTFKTRLASRREELVDPMITQSIEDRMKGAMSQSLEILQEKLEKEQSADLAMRVLEMGSRGAQYGARNAPPAPSVVINLPGSAASEGAWLNSTQLPPSKDQ